MNENKMAFTPKKIADSDPQIKFRIPLYQRPYAWQEKQVYLLLADLFDAYKTKPGADYHIGIMSVADSGDGSGTWDLIDGQQRMTTLMLIGNAAEIHVAEWGTFLTSDRLDLYGRTSDQALLERREKGDCNIRMWDAFQCAKAFLASKKPEFSKFIFEHAAFFVSRAPSDYSVIDKNQQFVRMNNRGKQLEKHEIIKVRLSSMIDDSRIRERFLVQWNGMLECLSEQAVSSSSDPLKLLDILNSPEITGTAPAKESLYSAIVSVPEFLLIALARLHQGAKISMKPDNLLDSFSCLDAARVAEFGEVLESHTTLLRRFFIFTTKSGRKLYELGLGKDTEDAAGFADMEETGALEALVIVQSFLHVSTAPDAWLIPAFEWCENKEVSIDPVAFTRRLEEIDAECRAVTLPSLDNMMYGSVGHYWFYRLDYELWKRYQDRENRQAENGVWRSLPMDAEEWVKGFQFRKCGSIEHINPQHPIAGEAESNIDSFGNLALISGSRNSKFSNETRDGKKQIIRDSQYSESLKMVHFLWCNPDNSDNSDSTQAGKLMYQLLTATLK